MGYGDTSALKDEIKSMMHQAMITVPPSSSSFECNLRALVTEADFQALGDLYLSNLNSVINELSSEGAKFRADLKTTTASMKFKADLEVNKAEI